MQCLAAPSAFFLSSTVRAGGLRSVSERFNTETAKMIIYKCVISNDEMFADTFKVTENGLFYEVEGKTITRTEGFDEALISANASAEDAAEGTDSSSVSGVDIVLNHKLQETCFSKKAYIQHLKDYVKSVKAKLEENKPERVQSFMAEASKGVKEHLANFDSYQFFSGESMNPDGMVGLLDYREDGITPYMLFFKDGLILEKC